MPSKDRSAAAAAAVVVVVNDDDVFEAAEAAAITRPATSGSFRNRRRPSDSRRRRRRRRRRRLVGVGTLLLLAVLLLQPSYRTTDTNAIRFASAASFAPAAVFSRRHLPRQGRSNSCTTAPGIDGDGGVRGGPATTATAATTTTTTKRRIQRAATRATAAEVSSRRRFLSRATATAAATATTMTTTASAAAAAAEAATSPTSAETASQQRQQDRLPAIPFSSVRKYRTIRLANGLKAVLVSDNAPPPLYKGQRQQQQQQLFASAALTVEGAGQFADPDEIPGLAHLMEHMVLSSNSTTALVTAASSTAAAAAVPSAASAKASTTASEAASPSGAVTVRSKIRQFARSGGAGRLQQQRSRDFEDWLSDLDGSSNGFTAYDMVCFHFSCDGAAFGEALERFASLFVQSNVERVCRDGDVLRREIRRVDSEIDFDDPATQAYYLSKSFVTLEHPFGRFSAGNLDSLERNLPDDVDLGRELISFFRRRYLPSRALLVVVGPQDLATLQRFVEIPFAYALSSQPRAIQSSQLTPLPEDGSRSRRRAVIIQPTTSAPITSTSTYPGGFLRGNRLKQMILYRKSGDQDTERLSFEWPLNLNYINGPVDNNNDENGNREYEVTATQIGFVLSQIIGRRGPGSLYSFLQRRRWIPGGLSGVPRITTPLDVSGFQILKFDLTITLDGFDNRYAIVSAVYDIVNSVLRDSRTTLTRELLAQYATMAKLHGYLLAPRPPDAVALAVDGQYYGIGTDTRGVGSGDWYRFPLPENRNSLDQLQRATVSALTAMSDPENAVIIASAGNKALTRTGLLDEQLPPLSSPRWLTEPISGARFYFDDMFKLSARRLEELVLTKLIDAEELQRPVLNPLIPPTLRPSRDVGNAGENSLYRPDMIIPPPDSEAYQGNALRSPSNRGEARGADWFFANPFPSQIGLPLPSGPPEPSCRCAFVLQLLSSRPARSNVRQAARAELWKLSFESAISDLAELGAVGGLAYDLSFNRYGMRLSFLGIGRTLPSYVRRICRRLVLHHFRLNDEPETLPSSLKAYAIASVVRAQGGGLTQVRKQRIVSNLRGSSASEAAFEGVSFLRSCRGATCFAQGDLLPDQLVALKNELREIFHVVIGGGGTGDDGGSITGSRLANPSIDDLVYKPNWKPRAASSCSLPGVPLISDACGRTLR